MMKCTLTADRPMRHRLQISVVVMLSSILCALAGQPPSSERTVKLVVPLKDGRHLSLRDFCRAANETLKTNYPIDKLPDKTLEISRLERTLVPLALEQAGLIEKGQIRFEKDQLILHLPNLENGDVRRNIRDLLRAVGLPLPEWPEGKGLVVGDNFDPAAKTVLFIHGLGSSCDGTFGKFTTCCRRDGVQVLSFDYPNQGPVEFSGKRLADDLAELSRKYPRLKATIVSHSMGGLVARHAVELAGPRPGCVTDLVTIGTPHAGSRLAEHSPLLRFAEQLLDRRPWTEFLADGLGEASVDLRPGSAILNRLARADRPTGIRYHVVIGKRALVDKSDLPGLEKEFRRYADWLRLPPEEGARLGKTIGELDEIVHGLGDGAVTVKSARLSGAASERVFDMNHLELVRGVDHGQVWDHVLTTLGWKKN
jgi:pimeloyl-ACP methyl ester carboxylesterase